ncbi:hypothetical protein [Pedobacter foliorum]|uniref:hypothetical protein n=1 Tax=Pedobacter foliorum TaxID=2739058 RepID=UPI001567675F|nr:hypothetical protein [Pedobacter foliorum]NRF40470.1 hypothetical protein [Pedobacter foliorum]
MGQGATLKIYNATPIQMSLTNKHQYQMNDWNPPASINANSASSYYVEYAQPFFSTNDPGDDGADAHYNLGSTSQTLWFMARAEDVPFGNSYTTNFWLQFQSTWDTSITNPTSQPYYMFWATGSTTWQLLNNNVMKIGDAVGDDPTLEFKIVQIDQYCTSEQQIISIGSDLMNGQQSSQQFQDFVSSVNSQISNW